MLSERQTGAGNQVSHNPGNPHFAQRTLSHDTSQFDLARVETCSER